MRWRSWGGVGVGCCGGRARAVVEGRGWGGEGAGRGVGALWGNAVDEALKGC